MEKVCEKTNEYSFMEHDAPVLRAVFRGGAEASAPDGSARFYKLSDGIFMRCEFCGLPEKRGFALEVIGGMVSEDDGKPSRALAEFSSDSDGKASAEALLDGELGQLAERALVLSMKDSGKRKVAVCGLAEHVL